jgi:cobalt/nickel transport system permease protein
VNGVTPTSLSDHIPDLNLITFYAQNRQTLFSRVSPWTKLSILILVSVFITVTKNIFLVAGLYILVLLVYRAAGLPVKNLFAWYALPAVFVLSFVGILAWSEPGHTIISFSLFTMPFTLTDNGILLIVLLLAKALTVVTWSLFFLMTTRYEHFAAMIDRIFPTPLDQIFLMAYRFLFLTLAMTASILKAVRSRGGGLIRSVRMQGKLFAEIFALVFIRSFERSERVHKAMVARGFSGSYGTAVEIPALHLYEYVLIGLCTALVIALAIRDPAAGRVLLL